MPLRETDPEVVGGYPVEDRLGSGGMGVVYLARSPSGRRLAVKVVHPQYADDPEFRTRFRREVAAARQVSGAFTAPVVDADADAPSPWMATLYIPGEDLGAYVRRHGPLPADRLPELAAGLAEALRDIHRAGVVHRDLKPANVMLAEDGPRVIDFGVSRAAETPVGDPLTQTGRVMGTPPYMSPEQLTAPRDVGPASDVFSLGSVLVHAATGRGPFDDASPYETATRVVKEDPDLTGVPDALRPFVARCLAKRPEDRPTPDALLALLRGEPLPPPARPADAGPPPAARPRRRRFALAGTAAAVVLAAAAVLAPLPASDGSPPGDLPAGWRAWQSRDMDDRGEAGGLFTRCAVAAGGLLCAGDDVKAARFSLATGAFRWSRPVDEDLTAADDWGNVEGHVIGVSGGRAFVYRNDQTERGDTRIENYAIEALDARTGRALWAVPAQRGEHASAPSPDAESGGAVLTSAGVLAAVGADGDAYALLGAADGDARWRHRFPVADCRVRAAAGQGYVICPAGDGRVRVSRLDLTSGRPGWTATLRAGPDLLGVSGGHLLFADTTREEQSHHRIVALDPVTRRARAVPFEHPQRSEARVTLSRGTLYFTHTNGVVRAVDPRTGRLTWDVNSTVESPGPPLASASHVYVASPSGRLAALDRGTGAVDWTRAAPDSYGETPSVASETGAALTLAGDALYVPYGVRAVYSVDVRHP
ncbi:serine/threonine-protein kinase [Streptomyces sp. CC224B]|uniref:serine/threonine-protein kinase n=1 Tax=Streptomyces sp. CC224B TaxID=3044571 RepID=UPI0024A86BA5|nr:serine/threonine-protein kinase [Streptomyces sp. CC224B]